MRTVHHTLKAFLFCGLIGVAFCLSVNLNANEGKETAAYFFIGGELLVFVNDTPHKVSRVTSDQIQIEQDGIERSVSVNNRIGLKPTPVITPAFVEIDDFDYFPSNRAAAREEVRILSELSYSQSMSDGEVGDIRSINPDWQDQELINQEEEFRTQMEGQVDDLRMLEDPWMDTITLQLTLTPKQDLEDVYLVCGISYDQGGVENNKGSRMIVHYLGSLGEGVAESFSITKPLERFKAVDSQCELFFYTGNAEPVAQPLANKFRPLNSEEAQQVRDLLKGALNN